MKISILIPTMGIRVYELERLLESLNNQTFNDFESVIVSQVHHAEVESLVSRYPALSIVHVKLEKKGLSYARNQGLKFCNGDWVVLSDDDAWYPMNGLEKISQNIAKKNLDIILSQIGNPIEKKRYKNYSQREYIITNKFKCMSISSIEIAFKKTSIQKYFDEEFGLGAKYGCGEEVDFLLNNYRFVKMGYVPEVTVFHPIKENNNDAKKSFAKGALYAKNFSRFIATLIIIRDKLKGRGKYIKDFKQGFKEYRKSHD